MGGGGLKNPRGAEKMMGGFSTQALPTFTPMMHNMTDQEPLFRMR